MPQQITITKLYKEIKEIRANMPTKQEIRSFLETIDIISNDQTMKQIKESEEDIKHGRVKEIRSASDI